MFIGELQRYSFATSGQSRASISLFTAFIDKISHSIQLLAVVSSLFNLYRKTINPKNEDDGLKLQKRVQCVGCSAVSRADAAVCSSDVADTEGLTCVWYL